MIFSRIPKKERPRERLFQKGSDSLTLVELLAILLRTGSREQDVMELSANLLDEWGGLKGLSRATPNEILHVKGMKHAKVSSLMAALEIGKRLAVEEMVHNDEWPMRLKARAQILKEEERELIVSLFLDTRGKVLAEESISYGGLEGAYMDFPFLFRRAVRLDATALVVMHNHPNGSLEPSDDDRKITQHLKRCAELLGLELKGHYVLASGQFRLI